MRREIGSEFWDVPVCDAKNSLFPNNTLWFLSGRIALKYIISDCSIKSVAIPRWCCNTMVDPFIQEGVHITYFDSIVPTETDAILIMDYFGYTDQYKVPDEYKGIVIRDVTHSIFSKNYDDADYYYGSLRKWAGFYTGGFAWKNGEWESEEIIAEPDTEYVEYRKKAMEQKKMYILGQSDSKEYLDLFSKAEERLNQCGISGSCAEDIEKALYLDIDFIKKTRRNNAKELIRHLESMYPIKETDCPLFVPIRLKNRNSIRNKLIENHIYCPVHWPESDLDGTELSIVCDQRYDVKDMQRICEVIDAFNI